MSYRLIHSRFPGKCPKCEAAYAAGSTIAYNARGEKGHKVLCTTCYQAQQQPEPTSTPTQEPKPEPMPVLPKPAKNVPEGEACRGYERYSDGIWRINFASVGEQVEYALAETDQCADSQNSHGLKWRRCEIDSHTRNNFYNNYDCNKVMQHINNPPGEFARKIDALRSELEGKIEMPIGTRRRVRHNQEDGEELDPVAVRQNRLNAWSDIHHERAAKQVIRIGCNMSVMCEVTREELFYRGAAVAALADLLTEQGYSVEILAFQSTRELSRKMDHCVTKTIVKQADMPLDINTVAFCLSEIGYYRTVCFMQRIRSAIGKADYEGMGFTALLPDADQREIDILADSNILGKEAAINFLKKHVNRAALADMAA